MPGNYTSLIDQVSALGNPRTALLLQTNGPVALGAIAPKVPAVVFSGYNGQSQAPPSPTCCSASRNPDGHLDFTWYADDSQLAGHAELRLNAASTGGLGRTYQYFTGTPTYPFGYGLSYSTFGIPNVNVDRVPVSAGGTGERRPGRDQHRAPQPAPRSPSCTRPPRARAPGRYAAAAGRVPEDPGAAARTDPAPDAAGGDQRPGAVDTAHSRFAVTDGTYQFRVGTDASTIVARRDVQVTGALPQHVQYVTVQPGAVSYTRVRPSTSPGRPVGWPTTPTRRAARS